MRYCIFFLVLPHFGLGTFWTGHSSSFCAGWCSYRQVSSVLGRFPREIWSWEVGSGSENTAAAQQTRGPPLSEIIGYDQKQCSNPLESKCFGNKIKIEQGKEISAGGGSGCSIKENRSVACLYAKSWRKWESWPVEHPDRTTLEQRPEGVQAHTWCVWEIAKRPVCLERSEQGREY